MKTMKRLFAGLLAVVMLTMATPVYAFSDVEDTKYEEAVELLAKLDIVNGFEDNTFRPEETVTRAQMATMIVNALGLKDAANSLNGHIVFADTEAHWANGVVNVAAAGNIITGYPDGTFKPDQEVNYAEVITMVVKALGYTEVPGTWPSNYVVKGTLLDLFEGVEYDAYATATRGNVAAIIWNMLNTEMYDTDETVLAARLAECNYYEEAIVKGYTVEDGEVTVAVNVKVEEKGRTKTKTIEGKVENIDLLRLVEGMTVAIIEKDDEIISIEAVNEIVEGFVTGTKEINEVKYKNAIGEDKGTYVIAEVKDNKIVNTKVIDTVAGYELTKANLNTLKAKNEDALVILDGEWTTVEALKVGDFVTAKGKDAEIIFAARNVVKGEYEGYRYVKGDLFVTITIDGAKYEVEYAKVKDMLKLEGEIELVFGHVGQLFSYEFEEDETNYDKLYFGVVAEEDHIIIDGDDTLVVIDDVEYVLADAKLANKINAEDFIIFKLNKDEEITAVATNLYFDRAIEIDELYRGVIYFEDGSELDYEELEEDRAWKDYQYVEIDITTDDEGVVFNSIEEVELSEDLFDTEDADKYFRKSLLDDWKFVLIFVED
jgi:hypothetical protein